MKALQFVNVFQHWCRILGTEGYTVHDIRIKLIACDSILTIWVTHKNVAFAYPVHEPF